MDLEKTISTRISVSLYNAVIQKCKACDVSISLVVKHALKAWIASPATLPTFTLQQSITPDGKTIMTKASMKEKKPVYTNTECGPWEKIKPIGEVRQVNEEDAIETADIIYEDEAGNRFNYNMEPIHPVTGQFQTLGKPKWWKEKRIDG